MASFLTEITDDQETYWVFFFMLSRIPSWLVMLLASFVSVIPDLALKVIENIRDNHTMNEAKKAEKQRERRMKGERRGGDEENEEEEETAVSGPVRKYSGATSQVESFNYETDASLITRGNPRGNPMTASRVRVFYIPSDQSKMCDTKVKEEDLFDDLSETPYQRPVTSKDSGSSSAHAGFSDSEIIKRHNRKL
jgi:hypothetical protein